MYKHGDNVKVRIGNGGSYRLALLIGIARYDRVRERKGDRERERERERER